MGTVNACWISKKQKKLVLPTLTNAGVCTQVESVKKNELMGRARWIDALCIQLPPLAFHIPADTLPC